MRSVAWRRASLRERICVLFVVVLAACSPDRSVPPLNATPTISASPSIQPTTRVTTSPSVRPSDSVTAPCGQVLLASQPRTVAATAAAVFASAEGLALYDVAANSTVPLDALVSTNGPVPRFRSSAIVSFDSLREPAVEGQTVGQDSLYEFDLESGRASETLRLPNSVLGFDWSPDGMLLAYLLRSDTPSRIGPRELCLFDARRSETSLLKRIERPFGTGTGQREETAITWAPNGRQVLAVETSAQPSLFVIDLEGRDVVSPRDGTFARWLTDDRILYQDDPHSDRPGGWFSLSTTTGRARQFSLPERAYRPAISPDGDRIAFDDGAEDPAIFIFDIDSGTSRRLAGGHVAPVWLGPDQVAATAAEPCSHSFCPVPWSAFSTTVSIDTVTGDQQQILLPRTLAEIHRYGVIDVLQPVPGS